MLSGMSDESSAAGVGRKARACPKCRNVMKPITFEDITVDRCVSCGGLWFDLMEQRHLKDRPGSEAIDTAPDRPKGATPAPAAKMKCPDCDAPLTRLKDVDRRDIEYEYCVVCNGAFFDGGEFRHYKDHSFLGSLRHLFGRRAAN
jgi:Zn-finger nucleic acid-binding protein